MAAIHEEFNAKKVQLVKHRLRSQGFDQFTSYKSYFNKHVAPLIRKKEDQVLIQYVFRALFNYRELTSQDINCSPKCLLNDKDLEAIVINITDDTFMERQSGEKDQTSEGFLEDIQNVLR